MTKISVRLNPSEEERDLQIHRTFEECLSVGDRCFISLDRQRQRV